MKTERQNDRGNTGKRNRWTEGQNERLKEGQRGRKRTTEKLRDKTTESQITEGPKDVGERRIERKNDRIYRIK